jgi:hypothetical protein
MNVYKQKLNQIKIALGMEVKMVSAKLEDGVTVVEAEAFEPGKEIFVVSESGEKAPAPEGTHTTEDGTKVTVDANGKIVSVEAKAEVEMAEEEVKTEEEIKENLGNCFEEDDIKSIVEKALDEKMGKMKFEYEEIIETIVKDMLDIKEEMRKYKEKMSKTPADKKISTFNTEAKEEKFDAVQARIEAINNIRAGKF